MAPSLSGPTLCFMLLAITALATAGKTSRPKNTEISPDEEAEQIVVEAKNTLLADPKLVDQVKNEVQTIRSENHDLAKTINNRKYQGKVKVESMVDVGKVNESEFGPVTSEPDEKSYIISFTKRYNPDVLTKELAKIGVAAQSIWVKGRDYGDIQWDSYKNNYIFRQGLENCKPNCNGNPYWFFTTSDGKSTLTGRYSAHVPVIQKRPYK